MSALDPPASPLHTSASPEGRIVLWSPAPRVLITRFTGHVVEAVAVKTAEAMSKLVGKETGWHSFGDCYDLDNYDKGTRIVVAEWAQSKRPQLAAMHVLVRSKLVAMGAAVINMTAGGFLQVYSSRPKFEQTLETTLRQTKPTLRLRTP